MYVSYSQNCVIVIIFTSTEKIVRLMYSYLIFVVWKYSIDSCSMYLGKISGVSVNPIEEEPGTIT